VYAAMREEHELKKMILDLMMIFINYLAKIDKLKLENIGGKF